MNRFKVMYRPSPMLFILYHFPKLFFAHTSAWQNPACSSGSDTSTTSCMEHLLSISESVFVMSLSKNVTFYCMLHLLVTKSVSDQIVSSLRADCLLIIFCLPRRYLADNLAYSGLLVNVNWDKISKYLHDHMISEIDMFYVSEIRLMKTSRS